MIDKFGVSYLANGSGSILSIFVIFMAGVFLITSVSISIFIIDHESLAGYIDKFHQVAGDGFPSYAFFVAICLSLGLSSYLLSYIFIGVPGFFLQAFVYKTPFGKRQWERMVEVVNVYLLDDGKNLHDIKSAMFFFAVEKSGKSLPDIRFLFTQVMFARSSLFSFLVTLFVILQLLRVKWYDLYLCIGASWVLSVCFYAAGGYIFDLSMTMSICAQRYSKKTLAKSPSRVERSAARDTT